MAMRKVLSAAILCTWSVTGVGPALSALKPEEGDLRDLKLGTPAEEMPKTGFVALTCASDPSRTLESWTEYRNCPPDEAGLHEIRFRYDQSENPLAGVNDRWAGTKVAGHPVLASVLLGDDGVLDGIRVVTDPDAPPYLRKRAFLLGIRVKERYGESGWTCVDRPREAGESDVGGNFVKQRCEKTDGPRRLVLETALYRKAGQSGRDFENAARLEIWRVRAGR